MKEKPIRIQMSSDSWQYLADKIGSFSEFDMQVIQRKILQAINAANPNDRRYAPNKITSSSLGVMDNELAADLILRLRSGSTVDSNDVAALESYLMARNRMTPEIIELIFLNATKVMSESKIDSIGLVSKMKPVQYEDSKTGKHLGTDSELLNALKGIGDKSDSNLDSDELDIGDL